jgi:hypothetical protein
VERSVRCTTLVALLLTIAACAAFALPTRALGDPPPVTGLVSASHPLGGHWYANANPTFSWLGLSPAAAIAGYSYTLDQDATAIPDTTVDLPALSFDVVSNATGVSSLSRATGDLNRDGRTDVVYGSRSTIEVRLARKNGTLGMAHGFSAIHTVNGLAVADVNGGGKPDVVVVSAVGVTHEVVGVMLGRDDGRLSAPRDYDLGSFSFGGPSAIAVRDLNGDHRRDILVVVGTDLVVLLGNGDGTFGRERISHSVAGDIYGDLADMRALALGDVNGDRRIDVVVGGRVAQNTPEGLLSVVLGNGDGTFRPRSTADSDLEPQRALLADLNKDGKLDLVVQYYNEGDFDGGPDYTILTALRGDGHGAFAKVADYDLLPQEGNPGFTAADFNRDGNIDLAIGSSVGLDVLLGIGDGSFEPPVTLGSGPVAGTIGGDFDGDGRPDVLCRLSGNAASVLLDRSAEASYAGVADGVWYFHVRAVDEGGTGGPTAARVVRIDTHPPTTHAPEPARVKTGGIARLTYIVDDPAPCAGWCNVRIVVTDTHGRVKLVLRARHVGDGVRSQVSFRCRLTKGTYYFHVRATDPAGNRSKVATDALFVR